MTVRHSCHISRKNKSTLGVTAASNNHVVIPCKKIAICTNGRTNGSTTCFVNQSSMVVHHGLLGGCRPPAYGRLDCGSQEFQTEGQYPSTVFWLLLYQPGHVRIRNQLAVCILIVSPFA